MKGVKRGRFVLIPTSLDTHGHFSHFYAKLWKPYLIEFRALTRRSTRRLRNSSPSFTF